MKSFVTKKWRHCWTVFKYEVLVLISHSFSACCCVFNTFALVLSKIECYYFRNEITEVSVFNYIMFHMSFILTACYYHVMYAFQGESTLYNCLNVNELLARDRRDIWSLSDSNGIRTHHHLLHKRTLTCSFMNEHLRVRLWTKWCGFESHCYVF